VAGRAPGYPPLDGDIEVDVAIVGGGIVGLTAATLLRRTGARVAVIEALKVGQQVTGRSTAKVTSQHGLIYQRFVKDFGEQGARVYGAANQAGLEQIARFAQDLEIECELERTAAYVYAHSEEQVAEIEREVEVAQRLGLQAPFVRELSLPFPIAGAIRFDEQGSSIRASTSWAWRERSRTPADRSSNASEPCGSSTASRAGSQPQRPARTAPHEIRRTRAIGAWNSAASEGYVAIKSPNAYGPGPRHGILQSVTGTRPEASAPMGVEGMHAAKTRPRPFRPQLVPMPLPPAQHCLMSACPSARSCGCPKCALLQPR
jgi:uncharacterized protein with NAD-binding domain and iron-sulfur cluster